MILFGRRQDKLDADERRALRDEVASLRSELTRHASLMRTLETEQGLMHDQVRKWMRRAVAAERVVARNQDPEHDATETPAPPPPAVWGARARRAARLARVANGRETSEGDSDGVRS